MSLLEQILRTGKICLILSIFKHPKFTFYSMIINLLIPEFFITYIHVCLCVCTLAQVSRCKKRLLDPLGLESQVVVTNLTWLLGTEHGYYRRAENSFNCHAIILTAHLTLKNKLMYQW